MEKRVQGAAPRSTRGVGGEECLRSPPRRTVLAVEAELRAGEGLRGLGMEGRHSDGTWSYAWGVPGRSKPGKAHLGAGRLGLSVGTAEPLRTSSCPVPPFILPQPPPDSPLNCIGVGPWTPGVVMDLRNSWVTGSAWDGQESQDLSAARPLPRLAQAADPKPRPGTWVQALGLAGWHTGARVQVQCHGSEPCSGLLPWTFRPSVTGELGERVQVADASAAEKDIVEEPQLWSQPCLG